MHEMPISGEEFFRETETGLAKYVRPRFEARRRLKVEELDPLEASMLVDPQLYPEYADENAEEENKTEDEPVDAQVQTDFSPMVEHRGPEPHVPHETVELPGSPPGTPDDLPDLPRVGLDWQNLDVAEEYFPRQQRERTQRVREVALLSEQKKSERILPVSPDGPVSKSTGYVLGSPTMVGP